MKSRLVGTKSTGGRVELLLERVLSLDEGLFQIRASHAPRPGQSIVLPGAVEAAVVRRHDRFFRLRFAGVASLADYLAAHAAVPLPPYITRAPTGADEARYQTVYARHPGAVAAPTAGLHFDAPLLDALQAAGVETAWVTLHVGAGTFLPVQVDDIATHTMHAECYRIPAATVAAVERARAARRPRHRRRHHQPARTRIGRAPDGAPAVRRGARPTLFVRPGYRFRVVDRLLTNFHLPRVDAADAGSRVRRLRADARGLSRTRSRARYRFFSYGDAMLLERSASVSVVTPKANTRKCRLIGDNAR